MAGGEMVKGVRGGASAWLISVSGVEGAVGRCCFWGIVLQTTSRSISSDSRIVISWIRPVKGRCQY